MRFTPATRSVAATAEPARPAAAPTPPESEHPDARPEGRLGRLAARVGEAVRAAHQASVPF
jgi:hypothetical protein